MHLPTVAFCGYGRAGKDTAGILLGEITPLRYVGSLSWHGKAVVAKRLGICEMLAWETRHERRMEWKRILDEYRADDPTRLIRDSLAHGEIVVGVRDRVELLAARREGLIDYALWIVRPETPVDLTVTYGPDDCDAVIHNSSSKDDLRRTLEFWARQKRIPLR